MLRPSLVALLALALLVPAGSALAEPASPPEPTQRARAQAALDKAQGLLDGRGVKTGRELTLVLAELARTREALPVEERREARAVLARPTDGIADPQGDGYTTSEATPYCTTNFCVHYVATGNDAPPNPDSDSDGFPDYVETMANEFEFSFIVENGTLGWTEPESDGTRGGGNAITDVYIKDIGNDGIFGYAAPEEGGQSAFSYLVMDDDYSEFSGFADPLDALRVTAAHEYNHALQFTYAAPQDFWMFESTATWMEEQVYPAINDYVNYLGTWAACTESPLTLFAQAGCGQKVYGTAVWNHWLEARYQDDAIRRAWEVSDTTTPANFAPGAYGQSVATEGGAGFEDEFGRFSAAVAEWRASTSVFPDRLSYPDAERTGTALAIDGAGRTETLDHTTFRLISVTPDLTKPLARLEATAPAGVNAAIALIGRTGSETAGTATVDYVRLPSGGTGSVSLANPGGFSRITAVLVNADVSISGFNPDPSVNDWVWTRDAQAFQNVRVVSSAPAGGGTGTGGDTGASGGATTTTSPAPSDSSTPTPTAFSAGAFVARIQRRATVLRRGVLARGRCNRGCRIRFEVRLARSTARRLGLPRVVGARTVILTRAGSRSVRVRLSRRTRARLRSGKVRALSVRMRATSGSQRSSLITRRVTIRR